MKTSRRLWRDEPRKSTFRRKRYGTSVCNFEVHLGIIALREAGLDRAGQWRRLKLALDFSSKRCDGDLVNKVLEVQEGGALKLHDVSRPDER